MANLGLGSCFICFIFFICFLCLSPPICYYSQEYYASNQIWGTLDSNGLFATLSISQEFDNFFELLHQPFQAFPHLFRIFFLVLIKTPHYFLDEGLSIFFNQFTLFKLLFYYLLSYGLN